MTTPRNGDAQARLRSHFATQDGKVLAASYSAQEYEMEIAPDGTVNIYERQPATSHATQDERISLGIDDPRSATSRLLDTSKKLASINSAHAEFWKRRGGMSK